MSSSSHLLGSSAWDSGIRIHLSVAPTFLCHPSMSYLAFGFAFLFFFFLLLCFSSCGSASLSQRFLVFPRVISWSVCSYLRLSSFFLPPLSNRSLFLGVSLSPLLLPSGCVCSLVTCFAFLRVFSPGLCSVFSRSSCSLALSFIAAVLPAVFRSYVSHFLFSILSVVSGVSVLRLLDLPWGLSLLFEFHFFSSASASCSQLYFLLSYSGMLASSCFPRIFWVSLLLLSLLFLQFRL